MELFYLKMVIILIEMVLILNSKYVTLSKDRLNQSKLVDSSKNYIIEENSMHIILVF